ncbi:hypothetical protein BDV96DRAFT_622875 [Lophiotrema nucula]|uniref:Glucose-methanol-choline oxidoreductase N-terminal domain-containing protein n=1 Tax=Lophiotrema nucula TaxID=690887 RepID=A0A6A5Z1X5_9PLEO|nr:hypothetical protein BDV96DRAFT_622875 [Lophiotrema nucula]
MLETLVTPQSTSGLPSGLLFIATAVTSTRLYETQIKRSVSDLLPSYDYIIIGGGTSGLTVADRLTAAFPSRSVLVVEHGDLINSTAILQPAATVPDPRYAFQITSQKEPGLSNRSFSVTVGKIVGGSSAINAQMFDRGSAADYDAWGDVAGEEFKEAGWSWDGLVPYFKKSVTFTPPSEQQAKDYGYTWDIEAAYGGNGSVQAVYPPFQWPSEKVMHKAWSELGVPAPKEGAGGDAVGVFWLPSSQDPKTQTRSYARTGHFDSVANRSNYHLLVGHKVTEVLLRETEDDDDRNFETTGVKIQAVSGNSSIIEVESKEEAILAAGAIHSPVILQRSGIGPNDVLKAANVSVKVELPGVGQNFQDHATSSLFYNMSTDLTPNAMSMFMNQTAMQEARRQYEQNKTGPLTLSGGNSGAFVPLSHLVAGNSSNTPAWIIGSLVTQIESASTYLPNATHPTVLAGYARQLSVLSDLLNATDNAVFEYPISSFAAMMAFLKPLSRGSVDIDAKNVLAEPIVRYRTFTNPVDVDLFVLGLKTLRSLYTTPSAKTLGPVELSPGSSVKTDEDWRKWVVKNVSPSFYHPVGTASLGARERGGVVGPDLRVHGVGSLRVVDASVMPLIPGTHTSSTVYAVAEKAADLIIRDGQRRK